MRPAIRPRQHGLLIRGQLPPAQATTDGPQNFGPAHRRHRRVAAGHSARRTCLLPAPAGPAPAVQPPASGNEREAPALAGPSRPARPPPPASPADTAPAAAPRTPTSPKIAPHRPSSAGAVRTPAPANAASFSAAVSSPGTHSRTCRRTCSHSARCPALSTPIRLGVSTLPIGPGYTQPYAWPPTAPYTGQWFMHAAQRMHRSISWNSVPIIAERPASTSTT